MTIKKTLGGDRLGSGKRMQVDLHGYERSTHDLGYLFRSTMSSGTLVPFMSEVALPGDTFDINLDCDVKTHPTIGPLFGSFKVQLDVFLTPMRLYNSLMHNNMLGIGLDMSRIKLPVIRMDAIPFPTDTSDYDNAQINPSSIFSYLGIRGVGRTAFDTVRDFNAIPYLAYWDIYKNYYSNKQEEVGAVIHTVLPAINETIDDIFIDGDTLVPAPAENAIALFDKSKFIINFTGAAPAIDSIFFNTSIGVLNALDIASDTIFGTTYAEFTFNSAKFGSIFVYNWRYRNSSDVANISPEVQFFALSNIDEMRKDILAYNSESTPFVITSSSWTPYQWPLGSTGGELWNRLCSQEGLAIKTYQSDLFNNWLQTEWFDGTSGINAITAIDTSSGSFTLDTLNLSKKVYDMLNRIAVSGGTYDDWIDAVYTHDRYKRAETPMYMGGLSKELVFQEVISNAQSSEQPLGTLGGRGVLSKKHKGGYIVVKVDEPSYITGIVSLTPRIDYSQGNKWDVHLKTMNDLHKPALDEIGFQELITEQMAWWNTEWDNDEDKWVTFSAGKQPAWINYMTNHNRTYGNFAIPDNEMFMTLNRRYERGEDGYISDLTTYVDPSKFNFIFAETAIDAQNFWVQIAVDITARRKMSAKVMPNL